MQLRQHVLDGRLQQGNHVGDELVLRLDVDKFVEMLVADIEALLNIGAFENGFLNVLLSGTEVLDELGGSIVGVRKHYGGFTLDHGEQLGIVEARLLECLDEKSVLNNFQLDLVAESGATQLAGLHRIQASDISNVEIGETLDLFAQSVDMLVFQFFSHNVS